MLTLTAHFQFPAPHLGTSVALIVPATEARMGRPFILRLPPPSSLYSASKDNEKCTVSFDILGRNPRQSHLKSELRDHECHVTSLMMNVNS